MKRSSCKSPLSGATEKRIKFCPSEVQLLIEQEVRCAVRQSESRLDALIEGLQQAECGVDYESSMQKLEARFNMVKKRADAALAYVMQTGISQPEDGKQKGPPPPRGDSLVSRTPEDRTQPASHDREKHSDTNGDICRMVEMTTKVLRKMQADNEALTATIQDCKKEAPWAALPRCGAAVPAECKETTTKTLINTKADHEALTASVQNVKKELPQADLPHCGSAVPPQSKETTTKAQIKVQADDEDNQCAALTAARQDFKRDAAECKTEIMPVKQEPEDHREHADGVKVENLSSDDHSPLRCTHPKDKLVYPPLPPTTFPSILNMEAASYNIPQRPSLQLALIRNPPGLSVLWNVEEEDPSAPPMDSYSVYMAVEKVKGSGVFPKWKTLGEVTAIKLPMCVLISKYKPGYKVCVAVVGKDKFGRYGPYSKVVPATIPEFLT